MRQTLSRGMVAAAAATSVLSLCGSPAFADSDAVRSSGPGTSAQDVSAPDSPDAASSEDRTPAEDLYGDSGDDSYGDDGTGSSGGSGESGGASAEAVTEGSPGVASGNNVQVPVEVPVNICGNSVDVIGVLNPTFGNRCETGDGDTTPPTVTPPTTPTPPAAAPPRTPPTKAPPVPEPAGGHEPPALAETGSGALLGASTSSAALILAGAILYRRSRRA